MRLDKRKTGRNRSDSIRFASDDFYTSLACLIIHSGLTENDVDFMNSEWCEALLDFIQCPLSGPELLSKYQKQKEEKANGESKSDS